MEKRYERNIAALSEQEMERLLQCRACVIGCGGLGGYIIEHLGRLGFKHITAVDADIFEESNLNRQLLSDESVLGQGKAATALLHMKKVNSKVGFTAINKKICEDNCEDILAGHDIVLDALDNTATRLIVERAAQKLAIPLIHGAVAGWYGQVCAILPGDTVLDRIYTGRENGGLEKEFGTLPFTAAVVASIQVCEAVKVLLNKEGTLAGRMLTLDLLENVYEIVEF